MQTANKNAYYKIYIFREYAKITYLFINKELESKYKLLVQHATRGLLHGDQSMLGRGDAQPQRTKAYV